MALEDLLEHFVSEVARRGLNHLVALAGPGRFCAHCRNDNLKEFSLTLPCCGRILCGPCVAHACLHKWATRCVVICEDCQTAHTFEAIKQSGKLVLKPLSR